MRILPLFLIGTCLLLGVMPGWSKTLIPLTEISIDSLKTLGNVHEITDGEVDINSDLLKRIEVGKSTLVFTFRNRSEKSQTPRFNVSLFNRYGMELANENVSWVFDSVKPGEVRKEEEKFYIPDLDRLFIQTNLTLPKDWREPSYLILK